MFRRCVRRGRMQHRSGQSRTQDPCEPSVGSAHVHAAQTHLGPPLVSHVIVHELVHACANVDCPQHSLGANATRVGKHKLCVARFAASPRPCFSVGCWTRPWSVVVP